MTAQDVLLPMYTTFIFFAGVLLDIRYGFLFFPSPDKVSSCSWLQKASSVYASAVGITAYGHVLHTHEHNFF
jgi:hypothetical protein